MKPVNADVSIIPSMPMLTTPDRSFRHGDFFQRSTDMYRRRLRALWCSPRNWPIQSEVHFEHARPMAKTLQFPAIIWRQMIARNPIELARRHVKEYGAMRRILRRQLIETLNFAAGDDFTAQRFEIGGQRIRNRL